MNKDEIIFCIGKEWDVKESGRVSKIVNKINNTESEEYFSFEVKNDTLMGAIGVTTEPVFDLKLKL